MNFEERLKKFYEDCDVWEDLAKRYCCTAEEQKIIHHAFVAMRDQHMHKIWEEGE